jgi:hypothetical protein
MLYIIQKCMWGYRGGITSRHPVVLAAVEAFYVIGISDITERRAKPGNLFYLVTLATLPVVPLGSRPLLPFARKMRTAS